MFNLREYVLVLFHDSKLGAFTLGAQHCALAQCLLGLALLDRYNIREFKLRTRRRQREGEMSKGLNEQNKDSARAFLRFQYISSLYSSK